VCGLVQTWRLAAVLLALSACNRESRTTAADLPQTPPMGAHDPRAARYERNAYQVAQGGRYFTWYGCGGCHGGGAKGVLDLGDTRWAHGSDLDRVYAFIAGGHPGRHARYGERIPPEQLWQITAYVRNLPQLAPERRRRQDLEQVGEPQGRIWAGPVQ
jgi:cytochrome c oxidase cbb3-type subunit 3